MTRGSMDARAADLSIAASTDTVKKITPMSKLRSLLEPDFDKLRGPNVVLNGFEKIMAKCDSLRL